jgi:hypothetical protein
MFRRAELMLDVVPAEVLAAAAFGWEYAVGPTLTEPPST